MNKPLAVFVGCCLLTGGVLTPAWATPPSGKDLVDRLGCLGCHALKGHGGSRGPAWDGVGARLTPQAIEQQVVSPQGRMPNFAQVKPEELKAVVDYLSGLR